MNASLLQTMKQMNRAIAQAMSQVMESQKTETQKMEAQKMEAQKVEDQKASAQSAEAQKAEFLRALAGIESNTAGGQLATANYQAPQPRRPPQQNRGGYAPRGRGRGGFRPAQPGLCRRCELGYHYMEDCEAPPRVSV